MKNLTVVRRLFTNVKLQKIRENYTVGLQDVISNFILRIKRRKSDLFARLAP